MLRTGWLFVLFAFPLLATAQPYAGAAPLPSSAVRAALLSPTPLNSEFAAPARAVGTSFPAGSFEGRGSDPWLAFDKVQHLTFSFLWTLGSQYALVNKVDVSEGGALPVSIASSAAVGLAKEYYDWRRGPRRVFSRRDLVADADGIILATGIILL